MQWISENITEDNKSDLKIKFVSFVKENQKGTNFTWLMEKKNEKTQPLPKHDMQKA